MNTINISLPSQLKLEADGLIKKGYFVSFSDLARTALRKLIAESKYDLWSTQAKEEYERGESVVLENPADIDKYFKSMSK